MIGLLITFGLLVASTRWLAKGVRVSTSNGSPVIPVPNWETMLVTSKLEVNKHYFIALQFSGAIDASKVEIVLANIFDPSSLRVFGGNDPLKGLPQIVPSDWLSAHDRGHVIVFGQYKGKDSDYFDNTLLQPLGAVGNATVWSSVEDYVSNSVIPQ